MLAHLDIETVREGDLVIGTLPVNMIADITERGASYRHLVMEVPAERRGQDLSAEEMEGYGARLEAFSAGRPSRRKGAERRP
ncbi:CRISPR-associated protein Csx16 [Martelella lutilitoris]|uniref:CRISPR-associated protein Csx16 n=1 Tax=Martelella lutilitoris TaxID=2583532 RepID=UPI001AEE4D9D|nr:CRISPR-associated protein Csx16 [Martelella lutilitoris]